MSAGASESARARRAARPPAARRRAARLLAAAALAGLLTGAGAATAVGDARSGAVLLGAIETLSRQVGYDPRRMDLLDGRRYVEA
ncbi:MAG: hypothetical protein ACJ74O_11015, partial [Frankiaceae bacterium]